MEKLLDRFLKYVKIETTSNEEIEKCPSTSSQTEFQKMLADELKEIGLDDISLSFRG